MATIWTEESIVQLILTKDEALFRAMKRLWEYQTDTEQVIGDAVEQNGVGFNKPDSQTVKHYLTKLTHGIEFKNWEIIKLRRIMVKYKGQLTKIANLNEMMKVH
jgi:hypothetical protein